MIRKAISQLAWDRLLSFADRARIAGALRVLDNPSDYLRVRLLGRPRVLRFKHGFSFECGPEELDLAVLFIALEWRGITLSNEARRASYAWAVSIDAGTITTPSGIVLALESCDNLILAETFLYDIHFAGHDLRGKTVVDIGAHRGDTALYYAEKGASVLAFEPDPSNFGFMQKNLALNPRLANRIQAFPWAVGPDGTVSFHAGLGASSAMDAEQGQIIEVESVSLGTIVHRHCDSPPFLLKADCKGCEYQIVEDPALSSFSNVAVEYSPVPGSGGPDAIIRALSRQGFRLTRMYKHQGGFFSLSEYGIICGQRSEGSEQ